MSLERPSWRGQLERQVVVRPLVRVLLALTVIAGGIASAALGAVLFFSKPALPYLSPLGAALLSVVLFATGLGFFWVGMRLIRADAATNNLLSPGARRRCSLVVGGVAAGMLVLAFEAQSALFLIAAAGVFVFSYFLFPLAED